MSNEVAGTFTLTNWDESAYLQLDGESKLTKVTIGQQFAGDFDAAGEWQGQMFYRPDGTAEYAGLHRFEGTLEGRRGSFVADSWGAFDGNEATSKWRIIDGSGTDELAGITGSGKSAAPSGSEGTYTLVYDLG